MPERSTTLDPRIRSSLCLKRTSGACHPRRAQASVPRDRQGIDYGEEQNVQKLHAAVLRPKCERHVTIKPFSLWTLVICGVVFFFAGFFSTRHDTNFTAANQEQGNSPPAQSTLQPVETGTASTSAVQSTITDANAPVVAHVAMKNMKFSPATIEIKNGDTVEWKNDDITPHTATSATFDSGPIASDAAWRHTFRQAGSFPFTCTFHPEMKGTVIVK